MLSALRDLRRLLHLWSTEHTRVSHLAAAVNLRRAVLIGPAVALFNGLCGTYFLLQLLFSANHADVVSRWQLALGLTHLAMGATMVGATLLARHLRHASRSLWGQAFPLLMLAAGMGFVLAITAIDQWVTANITPFVIACLLAGLVLYTRPTKAAWLFGALALVYVYAIGLTQHNPVLLASNRVNGVFACLTGWALSTLLWRKFTTITLQQEQIESLRSVLNERQRELERLTRTDGLTGLFNRNTFAELSKKELERAQRQGTSTTVLLMDLDHFKRINDTWGHPCGDAVLKHVAALANSTVRSTDLVGRLGGEEFIVLLPATSPDSARHLAEKLRHGLQRTTVKWEGQNIVVTVSIGVAGTTASERRSFDDLYREADKALYVAKQQGRNRVV